MALGQTAAHQGRVQPQAEVGHLGSAARGVLPPPRTDDLLDQPDLAIGSRPEPAQVTRLDAVPGQARGRMGDS